jgi:integral membrane protein
MLKLFRMIALLEGVSTILLFLIAMPLKYWFGQPGLIRPVGMTHGLLFIAYVIAMVPGLWGSRVGLLGWLRTFFAAFIPFGTFLNEPFLRRHEPVRGLN